MRTIIHQIDSLVLNRGGGSGVNSKPLLLRRKVANSKYADLIVTLFGEGREGGCIDYYFIRVYYSALLLFFLAPCVIRHTRLFRRKKTGGFENGNREGGASCSRSKVVYFHISVNH